MPPAPAGAARWLLLIHQVPTKPDYLRVKVRRRLERLGALPLKHSVYVLPHTPATAEDFQWLLREIVAAGGEGSICEATFVAGVTDDSLAAAFHAARDADYARLAAEAAAVAPAAEGNGDAPLAAAGTGAAALARMQQRLAEVVAIDHLGAPGRTGAEQAAAAAASRVAAAQAAVGAPTAARAGPEGGGAGRGRTWVTRAGVHVDRMASAWLIRRFLDPEARFRFVAAHDARGYRPAAGELRFDMFDGEYTHEGDRCTFETLLARFGLADPALAAMGEIVHDLDLKDAKFGRAEAAGVARLIDGIAAAHAADPARLEQAALAFDALYAAFRDVASGGTALTRDGGVDP